MAERKRDEARRAPEENEPERIAAREQRVDGMAEEHGLCHLDARDGHAGEDDAGDAPGFGAQKHDCPRIGLERVGSGRHGRGIQEGDPAGGSHAMNSARGPFLRHSVRIGAGAP